MEILAALNEHQREAVLHTEGPMLILAGAGSGKTRVITHRIAYLIQKGLAPPEQILAVTFTNKAAEEMKQRVVALLSGLPEARPWVSTFHSFCVKLLRREMEGLGYGRDFVIYDTDDQRRLLREILGVRHIQESVLPVREVQSLLSGLKNHPGRRLEDHPLGALLVEVAQEYRTRLRRANALDFDDLILESAELLRKFPEKRKAWSGRFRHILVDEYQDINLPQYDLICLLTSTHQNICVVGDEDQSIYGFRGSDIQNILNFEKDFPGARLVKLEQNYRSTQPILEAATAVVERNVHRKGKVLWTDVQEGDPITCFQAESARQEAEFVARAAYGSLRGLQHCGVLYRANFQSRLLEEALRQYGISYNLVGMSFYSRSEIKDVLAYLKVLVNPRDDVALVRVINVPPRGIGKSTLEKLQALARERGCSCWEALALAVEARLFPPRNLVALESFYLLLQDLARHRPATLYHSLRHVADQTHYEDMLRSEGSHEAQGRLENLQELYRAASEADESKLPLEEFLDRASLTSETDDFDSGARVSLMTLHSAKGLEFDTVFMVGMEEGLFPHSQALEDPWGIEEERRLCYVGMTRARRKLFLSWSRFRRKFGGEASGFNQPSRFLSEIPAHLVDQAPAGSFVSQATLRSMKAGSSSVTKSYDTVEKVKEFLQLKQSRHVSTGVYEPGTQVRHPVYGVGRILEAQPTGDGTKLTIQFEGFGRKKLIDRYAHLTLVT
ncbi:MAG: UvrD-helicase domain-containing protein [Acidobacteria bacterium]|nr:UvrD-helicase domain-containing protein [Acidobacteriota bacterium]